MKKAIVITIALLFCGLIITTSAQETIPYTSLGTVFAFFPYNLPQLNRLAPDGGALFVNQPTQYTMKCVCEDPGNIIGASLSANGEMIIDYVYTCYEKGYTGKLTGHYDADKHRFDGFYNTNNGMFQGETHFSFNENGEATGTWDHGAGNVEIRLKK